MRVPKMYYLQIIDLSSGKQTERKGDKTSLISDIAGTGLWYVLDAIEYEEVTDFEVSLINYPMEYRIKLIQ
jgi:hypothetical protein